MLIAVLVARREDLLANLKAEIEAEGVVSPTFAACDVGDRVQIERLRQAVEACWGAADLLINDVGLREYGPFEEADADVYDAVVRANLLGVVYCNKAILPRMLARGRERLVFISSIIGKLLLPSHDIYSATKFAVNGLPESLEIGCARICVLSRRAGLVRSQFAAWAGIPRKRFTQIPSVSAAAVARAIVQAIAAGKRKSVPDLFAHQAIKFRRHFSRLSRLVFQRMFRRIKSS